MLLTINVPMLTPGFNVPLMATVTGPQMLPVPPNLAPLATVTAPGPAPHERFGSLFISNVPLVTMVSPV